MKKTMKTILILTLLAAMTVAFDADKFILEKSTTAAAALNWSYTIPVDCEVDVVWVAIDPAPTTSENIVVSITPVAGGVAKTYTEIDPTLLPAMDDGRAMLIDKSMFGVPYRRGAIVKITYTNTDVGAITAGFSGWGYNR